MGNENREQPLQDIPRNPYALEGPWFNDECTRAWYPACNANGAQVVSESDALCEYIRDSETDLLMNGVKVFGGVFLVPHSNADVYEEEGRMVVIDQDEIGDRADVVEAWEVGCV